MANERRGYVSEAVLVAALQSLRFQLDSNLHWGKTPSCLKVCSSDVTIGDLENPRAIFQVTSSGYAGNFQMKFWRDMGELIEIKRLRPLTRVVGVLFEKGLKDKLVQISEFIADGVIRVADLKNGEELLQKITRIADGNLPVGRDARLEYVKRRLSERDLSSLSKALKDVLARDMRLWRLDLNRARTPAKFETINLRRAILVAALFASSPDMRSAHVLLAAVARNARLPEAPFTQALTDIGVCQRTIGGVKAVDRDLIAALAKLGVDKFVSLAAAALNENADSRWFAYVSMIHLLPEAIPVWFNALEEHVDILVRRPN
jgi:hypothetical protein